MPSDKTVRANFFIFITQSSESLWRRLIGAFPVALDLVLALTVIKSPLHHKNWRY